MLAASPAPDCTMTLKPSFASLPTASGTVATRFSPGNTSRGTPITCAMCIFPVGVSSILRPGRGGIAPHELHHDHQRHHPDADGVEQGGRIDEHEACHHQH